MANQGLKGYQKKALVAASLAGIVMMAGVAASPASAHAAGDKCYGVNKCAGTGECGGVGHGCAGKNACQGQAWLSIPQDTCLKIQGGSLTPAAS